VWPGNRLARCAAGRPGLRFWVFLALSAAARLFLETFRGDSTIVLNMFRQAQLIAWPVLAVSLWQVGRRLTPSGDKSPGLQDGAP
jgi:prolipoprotein diacylglyceryltransferase